MRHLGGDEVARQSRSLLVALLLGQMALEYRVRGPLPEIRLEDRRKGQPATGPPAANPVSPRRHRPGR